MIETIKKHNKGFTLAEVLVTLTLIGVVAAILIPAINQNAPNRNIVMLRKAYFTLEKAINNLINDDILYPNSQRIETSATSGIFIPMGFRYTTDDTNESITGGVTYNKFCFFLAEQLDLIGAQTCPASGVINVKKFATTADGIDWFIDNKWTQDRYNFPLNTYQTRIIVDVNGTKSPNCTRDIYCTDYETGDATWTCGTEITCPNPDTFFFGVKYNGTIILGNTNSETYKHTDTYAEEILATPLKNTK